MLVAIDGPAGAGKSTVARALARELGYTYLDTGAMYRAVALAAPRPVTELKIAFGPAGQVMLDGEDVSGRIRSAEVSAQASVVASQPTVRAALIARQRELIAGGDYVAEGRDIATVVAPEAEVKVFLTAAVAERARRRAADFGSDDLASVERDLAARDAADNGYGRTTTAAAAGAVTVDTTGLTIEQVVATLVAIVAQAERERKV